MTEDWKSDLDLAMSIADTADAISMRYFGLRQEPQVKDDNSLLTAADLEIERESVRLIRKVRPKDQIIAEETLASSLGGERTWCIDPIDHTNNFARGLPIFGTLIALLLEGRPVVGVISAPFRGQRWWAARDIGAFADGRHIKVSQVSTIQESHITFSGISDWERLGRLAQLSRLERDARWGFGGGGFMGQMWVAEGVMDVCLDSTGLVWDLAAAQIIVEEAGGRFSDLSGFPTPINQVSVVSNSILHEKVLGYLNETSQG